MCVFSKPKTPEISVPPPPAPAPVPTPSEVSPQVAGNSRRKQLERLRRGLSSTIKTKGMVGAGAELSSSNLAGRNTLG